MSNISQSSNFNNKFMKIALQEAQKAYDMDEVPVGCVITNRSTGDIIATACNTMQQKKNPNLHAEIIAINLACKKTGDKNLASCDIYVTLEPCTMCASAISNARLGSLYYGASDSKQGAVENGVRFYGSSACFHKPDIYGGIDASASADLLKKFFKKARKKSI